ncbi:dipeptide epimerase [Zavarzinella formosa]|uniref:dipeptide epimerase n=1 Tax=Zavarzinella formosa TaxID=360055 RepID=UPI0002E3B2F3|nr:dipeptide epimerase [Zavarzinella formosa]
MNIREMVAYIVRIPLKKRITHASHTRTETDNILVRVTLGDGTVGWGEGVPREYVTGESAESGIQILQAGDLKSQFHACRDFSQALAMIERFRPADQPGDERKITGNAARCAVELALLDAYGRVFGEPLCNIPKYLAPELFEFRDRVSYSGVITSAKGEMKLRLAAWRWKIFGTKQVKVKVGIEGYDDVNRLRKIRGRLGKNRDIRIDANEAWTPENAAGKIRELEPFGITSMEQPLPHARDAFLPALRKEINTPVMLDESLCGMVDAERAVADGWCDLFNLRLSKCGGFIPTLRLAEFARKHGLGYQLGCQVGETAILSAAGRHFATSVKDIRYLEGSYDRHLVHYMLGEEDITFGWGGIAPAIIRTGLGIKFQGDFIESRAIRREVLIG